MVNLFKGYVPTENKVPIKLFKNVPSSELATFEEIRGYREYAGIIADDIILIDIDDYEQSETLMDIIEDLQLRCRVYETTRGKHFVFKNISPTGDYMVDSCCTGKYLACGLSADIKVGCKTSIEVLKYDGKERPIIYDILENEDYESVPLWLTPIKGRPNFLNMAEGDGRNQALFNYILILQSNDISDNDCRDIIKLINKYILDESLSDEELEVILRDEAFKKPNFFTKKGTFLFDKFSRYLVNNNHIVKIDDQLCIYRDGIYVNGSKYIETQMIKHISNLNRSKRAEVVAYLDLLVGDNTGVSSADWIVFKNGVYNIETDEFEDLSPDKIIMNKINHDYNPEAYSEIVDKTLDKLACHDEQVRMLLEEVIGYCFYRRNELRKAPIFIGDKANGKSTYLDMIKTLLGDENTVALDLNELGARFKTAELHGKLAIIGDDIGDEFIPNPAIFKKVVSGDRINVERKGKDPFDFNNYAKPLFSANNIPRIRDKTGAVLSRLIIIPFDAKFSADDEDFDPYIKYKLRSDESMQYLVQLGLQGLKRVLNNRGFTTSDRATKALEEYEKNNNPILLFFDEIDVDEIIDEPTCDVYGKYNSFCMNNNFTPMSNIEFSKKVKKVYNLEIVDKKIKGKKYRVFVEKEEE